MQIHRYDQTIIELRFSGKRPNGITTKNVKEESVENVKRESRRKGLISATRRRERKSNVKEDGF